MKGLTSMENTPKNTENPGAVIDNNHKSTWYKDLWHYFSRSQAMILIGFLIVLMIFVTLIAPRFMQVANMAVIARSASFVALVALGQMTVMIAGLIDLSVGSIAGFAGIISAMIMSGLPWINPFVALIMGVLVGTTIGAINGLIVSKIKLNPFIVTLGMQFVLNGMILVVTGGWAVANLPKQIEFLGKATIGPVPVPTIITVVVAIILAFVLNRTYVGRRIYAMGGNKDAAILVGIPVDRTTILAYMISGTLAALAGVLMLARLASGQPTVGANWMLPSFAAPILGGAALSGGTGSVLGTLIGGLLMAVITNSIVMSGMSVYWENVVVGLVLFMAIIIDKFRKK